MKNPYLPTALLALVLFCSCGDDAGKQPAVDSDSVAETPPENPEPQFEISKYAGTYSFGTDANKEATGTILVHPIDNDMALVHLDVQNGPPSFHSGSYTHSVNIEGDSGLIWMNIDEDGECKILLRFNGNELTAKTYNDKGCGFGHGVSADHVYTRTSTEVPNYYLTGEGDTMWFSEHVENGLHVR